MFPFGRAGTIVPDAPIFLPTRQKRKLTLKLREKEPRLM
jgi:hypothetical protein